MHFQRSESDLNNVTRCWQHKRNALKILKANVKFHFQTYYKGCFLCCSTFTVFSPVQGRTATRTQPLSRLAERWRLTSARSATAHTRKAHGRLSVRPPAVRTSASGAKDWEQENTSANPHVNSWPFTQSTGHQGRTAALEHFRHL